MQSWIVTPTGREADVQMQTVAGNSVCWPASIPKAQHKLWRVLTGIGGALLFLTTTTLQW